MLKQLKWLGAVACFCLLLAACGNGTGSGSSWQYTALGDSLAVGVLDSEGGYVKRYDADVSSDTGVTVSLTNLGVNGARSNDLLNSLQNDPIFRSHVSSSQVAGIIASGQGTALPNGTTPCGGSLPALGKCTFNVSFYPASPGTISGVVTVSYGAGFSPVELKVNGTGQ